MLRRNLGPVAVFGLLGVATAQACFFNAVRYLPVGVALMLEYLGIVLVVGWMWLVHGQRPRRLTVVGSVAALVGLGLVLDLTGAGRLDPVGVLWGLGAAVGLAGYFVLAARVDADLPSVTMASGGMAVGAAVLAPARPDRGAAAAGHLRRGRLRRAAHQLARPDRRAVAGRRGGRLPDRDRRTRILGARLSSFVGLTEVMFAVLIAWLLLGELPMPVQLAGGALIVAGVALVRLDELREGRTERAAERTDEPALT